MGCNWDAEDKISVEHNFYTFFNVSILRPLPHVDVIEALTSSSLDKTSLQYTVSSQPALGTGGQEGGLFIKLMR